MRATNRLYHNTKFPRRSIHEDRQQQIVEVARKIITKQGMEHLTMDSLAEEIGLSEAAIYRHVDSKRDILQMVLEDIERALLGAVTNGCKKGDTPLDKLKYVLKAHLSYSERRKGLSFLVLDEIIHLDDRKLQVYASKVVERYLKGISQVLIEGQSDGTVRIDLDLDMATRLYFGMIQGNVTLWALQSHSFGLTDRHERLWDLYRRAVASHV